MITQTQKKDDRRNGETSSKCENKNQIIGYLNPTISIISFYVNEINKVKLYMLLTRIILQVQRDWINMPYKM